MWNLKKTMGFAVRFVVDNGACTGGLDVVTHDTYGAPG
jgi:hypothetical protein